MENIFISYSHRNEDLKDFVEEYLQAVTSAKAWSDRDIEVGSEWDQKIKETIANSRVAVLLITQQFLNSKYIMQHEVPALLDREEAGHMVIIPVILRHCTWDMHDFIVRLLGGTKDNIPLMEKGKVEQEKLLVELVKKIKALLEKQRTTLKNIARETELVKKELDNFRVLPKPTPIDGLDDIRNQVVDCLVQSIEKAGLSCLRERLAYHLKVPINSESSLDKEIAIALIDYRFDEACKGGVYETCLDFLPANRPDTDNELRIVKDLTNSETKRLKVAINKIIILLAIFELNDKALLEHCMKFDEYHYSIAGVSSGLGVELVLRRIGLGGTILPDIAPNVSNKINIGGRIVLSPESVGKWSSEYNINQALIDIWNIIESYRIGSAEPVKYSGVMLDDEEIRNINESILQYREDPRTPKCFFISYCLDDEEIASELFLALKEKLPNLISIAFYNSDSVSVFVSREYAISAMIENIYGQFKLFEETKKQG